MRIAQEAQHRFGRRVSWGAQSGDARKLFTTVSVPAMTRLRISEREVLDTLVEAGVARSRSHALAWCVRIVAQRQEEWRKDLRGALTHVEKVREEGPTSEPEPLLGAEAHPIQLASSHLVEQHDLLDTVLVEIAPGRPDPYLGCVGIGEARRVPDLLPGLIQIRPGEH